MKPLNEDYKEFHKGGEQALWELFLAIVCVATFVFGLAVYLSSCTSKVIPNKWISFKTYDSLVKATPAHDTLDLKGDSVLYEHTIIRTQDITVINAFFKREDQKTYIIIGNPNDSFLIVDNAYGLIEADRFIVATGQSWKECSPINVIRKIKGDTIYTNTSLKGWKAGTHLYKNINFFWILSVGRYTDQNCNFWNVTFDGNREHNKGSYYWNYNSAVLALSKGLTTYTDCRFINSPNESIVGHNAHIDDCKFLHDNGSGFHTSADAMYCSRDSIHSNIINSFFKHTNEIPDSLTGHSEGAITTSNSGGFFTAINNIFDSVGEAVIGGLYCSQSKHDYGTDNILFYGNTIYGYDKTRLVFGIDMTRPGQITGVNIHSNNVTGIVKTDYSKQLEKYPGIKIEQ